MRGPVNCAADLDGFSDALIRHAFMTGTATRVLRYLGRPVTQAGGPRADFHGDVHSQLLEFHDGVRVRHWLDQNSAKAYTELNNLRLEATVNDPTVFYVHRHARRESPQAPKQLRPLRKGVADTHRLAQVADACNDRYLTALASVAADVPLGHLARDLCRPTSWQGRRARALNPFSPHDANLLRAISRADFCLRGLENKDLRSLLFPPSEPGSPLRRRQSAATTRLIRLLRAHGLLAKTPKSRQYRLSSKARAAVSALLAAHDASAEKLTQKAA